MFAQYQYIQRVAVTARNTDLGYGACKIRDPFGTISLRDEAVVRWDNIRILLRAVDLQISRFLVDLIFHCVTRDDLDEYGHLFGHAFADRDAVPRVGFVRSEHTFIIESVRFNV